MESFFDKREKNHQNPPPIPAFCKKAGRRLLWEFIQQMQDPPQEQQRDGQTDDLRDGEGEPYILQDTGEGKKIGDGDEYEELTPHHL